MGNKLFELCLKYAKDGVEKIAPQHLIDAEEMEEVGIYMDEMRQRVKEEEDHWETTVVRHNEMLNRLGWRLHNTGSLTNADWKEIVLGEEK